LNIIIGILSSAYELFLEMAPFLVLGFVFAGIMNEFISAKKVAAHLGKNNFTSVIKAALFGIPLPLCSCGVIPPTMELRKAGAGKGAVVSFLVATPTTGVDSIAATYALMGPVFTVYRVIASFFSGIFSGTITNIFNKESQTEKNTELEETNKEKLSLPRRIVRVLNYAFFDLLSEIGKWLVIGILIGGAITYFIPEDFFGGVLQNGWQTILAMIVISVPIYVCATGSIPIAAALMMKGLNPGAAFVFLLAGPATNSVTITVVSRFLGKKTTVIYLVTLILISLGFGFLLDYLWQQFDFGFSFHQHHQHEMLPYWLKLSTTVLLALAILFNFSKPFFKKNKKENTKGLHMNYELNVPDMTCQNCVRHVSHAAQAVQGVQDVNVDLSSKKVKIYADDGVAQDIIVKAIEDAGYAVKK